MINHFLFKNVSNYDSSLLIKHNYKNKTILFHENDKCNSVYLVISGIINVATFTYDGKEYIFNVLKENDIFGDTPTFSNNTFLGDFIALTDVELIEIKKDNFIKLLQNETILNNYLNYISKKNLKLRYQVKLYSQTSIRDRILFYLNNEAKNSKVIRIKSKELLAKELNILRPSLSRELINLKKEGIIDYNKKEIILLKKW